MSCDCFPDIDPKWLASIDTEIGKPEWHALYTVVLGSLIEDGIFSWDNEYLNWKSAAYDDEQYERVCAYFIERYRYEEISILPVKQWMLFLRRRLVYELMPKYRIMYAEAAKNYRFDFGGLEKGWDVRDTAEHQETTGNETATDNTTGTSIRETNEAGHADDYGKSRDIESDYPETLLSGNADYISNGRDEENERLHDETRNETETGSTTANGSSVKDTAGQRDGTGSMRSSFEHEKEVTTLERLEAMTAYIEQIGQIDKSLLDELENMFVQIYTVNVNGI